MRLVGALVAAIAGSMLVFEVTMNPSPAERMDLFQMFAVLAVFTALVGSAVIRLSRRLRSLRTGVVLLAGASVGIVVAAAAATAKLMFITVHDLQLLFVVLTFGLALGLILAVSVVRPLTEDLRRMEQAARRVGRGDLGTSTGVNRPDELGKTAAAFDAMVAELATVDRERQNLERERREFLAAIGHDLRTPLAALQAAVEALEDGVAADPARYLRSMRCDVDALRHLVEDLFTLSTIEAGKYAISMHPTDLGELIDETVDALHPTATSAGVTLSAPNAATLRISADDDALRRVLRNLVQNAIRYAGEGGTVTVEAFLVGATVCVAVRDSGPGFPADFVEAAFDSFSMVDTARRRESGGAGLGLAIARGLVEGHGGTIEAFPGPGGRVEFRLPIITEVEMVSAT
jgi:signal transduction histidine kinase